MPNSTDAELRQNILHLQERLALLAVDRERDAALAQEAAIRLNFFEAMLEIVPVGVVLTDVKGRVMLGNTAVENMLRHPILLSEDVTDYGAWISFHEDGRQVESHEYPLAKVISEGVDRSELDVLYQRGDDSKFWMRIIGQPVRDKAGGLLGAVVALIDIDREHQLAEQQKVLIAELNHRVKNAFSVVKSIVSMSLRKEEIPRGVRSTIDERLDAYAKAHGKLIGSEWEQANLAQIVDDIVVRIAGDKLFYDGPAVALPSRQALAVSMALYELSSNAVKYGSLSVTTGKVDLTWCRITEEGQPKLRIEWVEREGPEPVVPTQKGFGTFIIDQALAMETNGEVDICYSADGLRWRLVMPFAQLTGE
ncbi:HWE histidine kinase domain-containing protein [Roseovarius sp. Pro17]|uniref:HWE histidine kinase domain-containing protein n=1 Tax=Roseovarius sp. Pro17 TaxID=3108175 RepID=UPI002D79F9E6|nr:HWE histidine kinase domain-containing protein [Roseovarius sp. Pro17]